MIKIKIEVLCSNHKFDFAIKKIYKDTMIKQIMKKYF